jgi:polyisoprenoid-binding protein YceI
MSTQGLDIPSELGLPIGTWNVDPSGSRLEFAVKTMWGLATVKGRFERFEGLLEVGRDSARGELTIEAASLETGHPKRDTHLRSADFFDVSDHPTVSFVATAITPRPGQDLTISGDLTVAGRVVRTQLPVRVTREEQGRLHLATALTVTREQVGMTWNRGGMIRGPVQLTVELELAPAARPTGDGADDDALSTDPIKRRVPVPQRTAG